MTTATEKDIQLRGLEDKVSKGRTDAQNALLRLEATVFSLMHKVVKAIVIEQYKSYSNRGVFSRDPTRTKSAWSDQYCGYDFGTKREPLVGLVIGYEISDDGSVQLTFVIPGKKKEYMIYARYYKLEVLDSFPTEG